MEDHSARVARLNHWGKEYNVDICDMDTVFIAVRMDECFADVENSGLIWHPDSANYRKTPAFKAFVNEHLSDYWELNGHPPQCRKLDDGEYECD